MIMQSRKAGNDEQEQDEVADEESEEPRVLHAVRRHCEGAVNMNNQANIREEELKNRVAALYFGKFDCTRIVGNIDFCVSPKRRDPRQMTFVPDAPILWARPRTIRWTYTGCSRS